MSGPAAAASAAAGAVAAAPVTAAAGHSDDETAANLPPTVLAIRTRSGIDFVRGPFPRALQQPAEPASSQSTPQPIPSGDHNFVYSADGALLCALTASSADVYDCSVWPPALHFSIARPGVVHCCFSPLHSYLVTYERRSTNNSENLHVWDTSSGEHVLAFFHSREIHVECWPLQWTADERLLCHQVSNEVQLHSGSQPTTAVLARLHVANVSQFSVGPSQQAPYHIAVFSPVRAADPARIGLHSLDATLASNALLSRSVYQAEEMTVRWSRNGLACLVETTTATDSSGGSYFGTSHLHLFSADSSAPFTCTVEFGGNEGPVHDFCFLPSLRQEFMVVQGYQPAVATLFSVQSGSCVAVKQYGRAPRNTVRVSPHGRFLMIGGFGNLSGEMDLFDSWKFKRIGECADRDGAKSYQWTNDSRHIVLAVLRPWRRVLNGLKVFDYSGQLLLHRQYDELYQVAVQPVKDAATVYPNRPASPGLKERRAAAAAASANSTAAATATAGPAAYVPPHLRGRVGGEAVNVVAAMIADDKGRQTHKKLAAANNSNSNHSSSSSHTPSHNTSSSKRSAPHQAHHTPNRANPASDAADNKGEHSRDREGEERKQCDEEQTAAATSASADSTATSSSSSSSPSLASPANESALSAEACEKRLRAAVKKQRQISELVARRVSGQQLDQGQQDKLRAATEVEAEVERLRKRVEQLKSGT